MFYFVMFLKKHTWISDHQVFKRTRVHRLSLKFYNLKFDLKSKAKYQVCLPKVASADLIQPSTGHSAHLSQARKKLEETRGWLCQVPSKHRHWFKQNTITSIPAQEFASLPSTETSQIRLSKLKSSNHGFNDCTGMLDSAKEFLFLRATQTLSTSLESFTG